MFMRRKYVLWRCALVYERLRCERALEALGIVWFLRSNGLGLLPQSRFPMGGPWVGAHLEPQSLGFEWRVPRIHPSVGPRCLQ